VKYVGNGMGILPARRSATAALSSENRLPETRASEKLFLACNFDTLANT
jgi:hypothetical protein